MKTGIASFSAISSLGNYDKSGLEAIRAALQNPKHGWSQDGAKLVDTILREIDALERNNQGVADLDSWLSGTSSPLPGLHLSEDDLANFEQAPGLKITPSTAPFNPNEFEKIKNALNNPTWGWSQSGAQLRNQVFEAINRIEQNEGTTADLQSLFDKLSTSGVSESDLDHFTEAFQGTSLKLPSQGGSTPSSSTKDQAMQDLYNQLTNQPSTLALAMASDPRFGDLKNYLSQLAQFSKDFNNAWDGMMQGFQNDWSQNPANINAVLNAHNSALENFLKYYGPLFQQRLENIETAVPSNFTFEGQSISSADFTNFIKGLPEYNKALSNAPDSSIQNIPKEDPTFKAPAHLLPSPSDPVSNSGNTSITYYNQSGKSASDVYILLMGKDPSNMKDCYIYYNAKGLPVYKDVESTDRGMTYSEDYSFPLSRLPRSSDGGYILSIPPGEGRVYTSNSPLKFNIDPATQKICEPDPASKSDANYKTHYDKVEWSNIKGLLTMNTTAVDYFGLPLSISMNSTTGTRETSGVQLSKAEVDAKVAAILAQGGDAWKELSLDGGRIISPNQLLSQHPELADKLFPGDWLSKVENYFSTHSIQIDARELGRDDKNGLYTSSYDASSKTLTFTNAAGDKVQIPIGNLTALQVVSGNGPVSFSKDTPGRIITRDLTALIETNLLTSVPSGTIINKDFFIANHSKCYQEDTSLPANQRLHFIDYLSKAMHEIGNIYSFSSDDVIGYDGTETGFVNGANASITLGPL